MRKRPSNEQMAENLQRFYERPAYGASEEDVELDSPASSFDTGLTLAEKKQRAIDRRLKQ